MFWLSADSIFVLGAGTTKISYPRFLSSTGPPSPVRETSFQCDELENPGTEKGSWESICARGGKESGVHFIKQMLCLDEKDNSSPPLRKGRKDTSSRMYVCAMQTWQEVVSGWGWGEEGEVRDEAGTPGCSQIVKGLCGPCESVCATS